MWYSNFSLRVMKIDDHMTLFFSFVPCGQILYDFVVLVFCCILSNFEPERSCCQHKNLALWLEGKPIYEFTNYNPSYSQAQSKLSLGWPYLRVPLKLLCDFINCLSSLCFFFFFQLLLTSIMWWLCTSTATSWEAYLPFSGFPLVFWFLYFTCSCSNLFGKNIAQAMIVLDRGKNLFFSFSLLSCPFFLTCSQGGFSIFIIVNKRLESSKRMII